MLQLPSHCRPVVLAADRYVGLGESRQHSAQQSVLSESWRYGMVVHVARLVLWVVRGDAARFAFFPLLTLVADIVV